MRWPPAVLLMGPTASGKSALALALAARLAALGRPCEIISVDSVQVYRGMDVGTAKPSAVERAQVPHHLIDICDPAESYSAARFAADARVLIAQIRARGNLPLLVGGTFLYFRALTQGLSTLPSADAALRTQISARAAVEGWPALHAELATQDPASAQRLHPNDGQRIQRALEVLRLGNAPLSALQGRGRSAGEVEGPRLALMPPARADLHARIEQRLDAMMRAGFLDEVRSLHARGDLHPGLPAVRAVGYRQLWAHLDGECDLASAQARALAATRQFAKRQITWLRSEHDLCWLNPDAPDAVDMALGFILGWSPKTPC